MHTNFYPPSNQSLYQDKIIDLKVICHFYLIKINKPRARIGLAIFSLPRRRFATEPPRHEI